MNVVEGQDLSTFALIWAAGIFVLDNVIRIVSLFVVPRNRRPTSGMAWLMAIFWLPIPGFLLFLIIGSNRLPRRRTEKQGQINELVASIASRESRGLNTPTEHLPPYLVPVVQLGNELGAQPMLQGNRATMTYEYERVFEAIAHDIDQAKRYVHIQFYIFVLDDTTRVVFDAMRRAIERGVEVRVLLDHVSAVRNAFGKETREALYEMGAQWSYMLPVRPWRGEYQRPDLRNHRKIVVVDGQVGYMGSQNIVDASYNLKKNIRRGLLWRDLMVRLEGM